MQVLISLLIFFLPSQLGKHFFFNFSYLNGVRVDYLAPTIYLSDFIIFLLIAINIRKIKNIFKNKIFISIILIAAINIVFAISKEVALYRWIKIVEVFCLFYVLNQNKQIPKNLITIPLLLTTLLQFILATLQFISQRSLQGIFYYFGERSFTLSTPGIAKASLNGVEFLRPYGTFSHPNSLAGFFLLIYFFVLTTFNEKHSPLIKYSLLLLSSFLIFISFSKIAIGTFLILNIFWLIKTKFYKHCVFCFTARIAVLSIITIIVLSATTDVFTIDKRWELIRNSVEIIKKYPFFGVGLGNYVVAQKDFQTLYLNFLNQPVHNVFLLTVTELGIPLASLIVWSIFLYLKKNLNQTLFLLVAVILTTGMFDHYWLTLQQNILLIPVVAYLFKKSEVDIT